MDKRANIKEHDNFISTMFEITKGMRYDHAIKVISTIIDYGERVAEETERIKAQYLQQRKFVLDTPSRIEKYAYQSALKKVNPPSIQRIRSRIIERDESPEIFDTTKRFNGESDVLSIHMGVGLPHVYEVGTFESEIVKECMRSILDHVRSYIHRIRDEDINQMIRILLEARKIFIIGAGRSGLVGKAFAMRLMHLGLDVHVVGETTTPAFTKEDVLVTISGSGETNSVLTSAKVAKQKGGRVVAITSYPRSTLAQIADCLVIVKGRTKEDMSASCIESELYLHQQLTPLGTLFEDCCMIYLEGIVTSLIEVLDTSEKGMKDKHAVSE